MDHKDSSWAAFRASIISPLLTGEVACGERGRYFHEQSRKEHLLPNGQRRRLSERTLRRWWKQLREQGIQGVLPKRRSDRGTARRRHRAMVARAVELKREQPRRSDRVINQILRREFGSQLSRTTLYRQLRIQGATRRQLGCSNQKVRCRWTRDVPGALWVGDFEHGPIVLHRGQATKTHLSAWIDCHSRYVVEARYYVRENLDILIDSLLRAWGVHGASRELYVDNAKIYHANGLVMACAQLQIKLLHRPPREPQPGGLIERFFSTAQTQFEAEVRASRILTLNELNRAWQAWLGSAYHQQIHSETDQKPADRYSSQTRLIRTVDVRSVGKFFFRREKRKVDLDHSDVVLDYVFYKVDLKLRGMELIVQSDPFMAVGMDGADGGQPDEVELFSLHEIYLGVGRRYQRQRGAHLQPELEPRQPLDSVYIDTLLKDHEDAHQASRQAGIDYTTAMQHGQLTLTRLGQLMAKLLGRSGGLSSLLSEEFQALQTLHAKHPHIRESQVREAFQKVNAPEPTMANVLWELQSLLSRSSKEF